MVQTHRKPWIHGVAWNIGFLTSPGRMPVFSRKKIRSVVAATVYTRGKSDEVG